MRKLGLAMVVAGCAAPDVPALGEQQQAERMAFHVLLSGTAADASYVDARHSVHVQVGESRDSGFPTEAFLFYDMYEIDDAGRVIIDYGFGAIPVSDVAITPMNGQLRTSTSVAGFTTAHCINESGTFTCTDGISGAIEMSWQQSGAWTSFGSGISVLRTEAFTQQNEGTVWSVMAMATGNIVGRPIEIAYGNLSDTRQNQMGVNFTRNF